MSATKFAEIAKSAVERFEKKNGSNTQEFVENALKLKKQIFDSTYKGPKVTYKEIMTAADFPNLINKVVTDQLQVPSEGEYIGVELFAKTIQLQPNTTMVYPVIGQVTAKDMARLATFERVTPAMTERIMAADALRVGLAFDFEPEFLDDSYFNIVGFCVEAGRRALLRHKEEKVWNSVLAGAHVFFDNSLPDSNAWTAGMAADGVTQNGSMAFNDFIDMMAGLINNGYSPTDIIANPMAWAILQKDPILRATFFTQGALGSGIWNKIPGITAGDAQSLLPWAVKYHVSRFMPVTPGNTLTSGVPGTTGVATTTDILMVDRNNPILIMSSMAPSMRQWQNSPEVEVTTLGMEERYALYNFDQYRSAVKAKNVRLVDNHAPLYTTSQVIL